MISNIRNKSVFGFLLCAVTSASISLASTLGDQPLGTCLEQENCETKQPAAPETLTTSSIEIAPVIHRTRISTEHVGRR